MLWTDFLLKWTVALEHCKRSSNVDYINHISAKLTLDDLRARESVAIKNWDLMERQLLQDSLAHLRDAAQMDYVLHGYDCTRFGPLWKALGTIVVVATSLTGLQLLLVLEEVVATDGLDPRAIVRRVFKAWGMGPARSPDALEAVFDDLYGE